MPDTAEKTSVYALIGTTTPDPQGRSGRLEVIATFDSREKAEEDWEGIAHRTLHRYPSDWVTHGFRLVEVPSAKRETFEQMRDTHRRAKKDPEAVFADEDGSVYPHKVHQRLRAFRGRLQQHLQSLIDNHKLE